MKTKIGFEWCQFTHDITLSKAQEQILMKNVFRCFTKNIPSASLVMHSSKCEKNSKIGNHQNGHKSSDIFNKIVVEDLKNKTETV